MTRRTCRTCLKSINGNECVRLQSSIQALEIEAELRFCMPEINFNLIDEAYMCCRCVDSLHQSYLFKNECLRSEERIRNFVKANQDKDISLEELSVNNNLEAGSNVDVIDELNSVLDEVLKQNLPCTSNLVLSNVVDDVSDSMYTFSQSIVQSRTNLTKKSCVVYLAKVSVQPGDVRFVCSKCDQIYTTRTLLQQHAYTKHNRLKRQLVPHLDVVGYRCNVCNFVGNRKDYVKAHMSRIHKGYEIIRCPVNGSKCVVPQNEMESAISDSMEIFTKRRKSTCVSNELEISTVQLSTLTRTKSPQNNMTSSPVTCNICDKQLARASYLRDHQRKHRGALPFFCSRCRFRCASKVELEEHVPSHSRGKYACKYCEFYTDRYSSIVSHHARMHKGRRRYAF